MAGVTVIRDAGSLAEIRFALAFVTTQMDLNTLFISAAGSR
jgi:hypothetical protein